MKKAWFDEAWEDYFYWQIQDKKIIKRTNLLIKDIERNIIFYKSFHAKHIMIFDA